MFLPLFVLALKLEGEDDLRDAGSWLRFDPKSVIRGTGWHVMRAVTTCACGSILANTVRIVHLKGTLHSLHYQ